MSPLFALLEASISDVPFVCLSVMSPLFASGYGHSDVVDPWYKSNILPTLKQRAFKAFAVEQSSEPVLVNDSALNQQLIGLLESARAAERRGDEGSLYAELSIFSALVRENREAFIEPEAVDFLIGNADVLARVVKEELPQDVVGPIIQQVQRLGVQSATTNILLTFSEPLETVAASNLGTYRFVTPGRDGRFGTRDDQSISIKSVVYDAASNSITLTPTHRFRPNERVRLIIDGTTDAALTDRAGNRLDGDGDGKAGGDYQGFLPLGPTGFGKGRDAFVTTLYTEMLGRAPEPKGRFFWSQQLARGVRPRSVARSFWNSPERRALVQHHKAPTIRFEQAFLDAKKAWVHARA